MTWPAAPLPLSAVQAALDVLPANLAVLDMRGQIVAVNAAWQEFMTASGGEPARCGVGSDYLAVCDGAQGPCSDEAGPVASGLRAVLSGDHDQFQYEYPCHGPDQPRWFALRARPFEQGGDRYLMVAHEDVTAQRETEIRAQDLNSEVDRQVRQRVVALEQANDELDAFAGAISHDLRAPVRHIRMFLARFRARVTGDRLRPEEDRLLGFVEEASGRLSQMIDELLALARVSQQPLHFAPVALDAVVQGAWSRLAPEAAGRRVHWGPGPLPRVSGDAQLLGLAFENLLSNALKYTAGRDPAHIEVGARDSGDHWTVFVRDDGVGFDPTYQARLFGAFARLHSEREFSGVGMGLANVKRIVARHGGEVWAEGHQGQGATFYLRLPKLAPDAGGPHP